MSRNSLLEAGAKSEGEVTATGLNPGADCFTEVYSFELKMISNENNDKR